ncbi:uncharacterized protein B0J16DRAFT_345860 [Fusarium flagelliforme]|uniref:uncharacterized protein n=1 Tax=Fusarium flagelliforme TaxID=2675880 RepID=UPI001E8DEC8A|nr:uncharacterized protein B0J16DRAFT_345860 [Fusarium flagelliforme]KAH7183489.1 hypothetical protein B0J16DRAFT_345860 [Fusarium flagelliforme]
MDSDEENNSVVSSTRRIPEQKLSCDQCRQRKVKCDRVDPCGPCQRKQIHCSYPAGFKTRARRTRALVSDGYEDKLNDISHKLDQISFAVNKITSPLPHLQGSSSAAHTALISHITPKSYTESPVEEAESNDDSTSELDGDVTLTTQATFATNFLEQVVNSNKGSNQPSEIEKSLDALRKVLTAKNADDGEPGLVDTQRILSPTSQGGYQLPPMHLAMMAIQKLRESPRLKCFWCIEFNTIGQFVEYFMTVYFGKPTLADLIITHAGLQRLLFECAKTEQNEALKNDFLTQGMLCRQNLETILAGLPFNLPCTFDYVLALYMAATYYLDRCRISLSWNTLAAAAQMCQRLGLIRETLPKPETREEKQRRGKLVSWIHMIDKMLSMRLSRPSLIRAGEITLNFEGLEAFGSDGLPPIIAKWIKVCDLQGRVYDDLYCPRALLLGDEARAERARQLAGEIKVAFESKSATEDRFIEESRMGVGDTLTDLFQRADQIAYLSMLCLVYRAIKPKTSTSSAFCDECLEVAKQALDEHRICLSILKEGEAGMLEHYVHWAFMAVPLIPFIVLFCHAIETCEPTHLENLAAVVEIAHITTDLPDVYRKQLHLFKLMYDVACKYINSRTTNPVVHASGRIPDTPFEMLFVEAGVPLPPQTIHHDQGMGFGDFPVGEMDQSLTHSMELGNWFEQNQEIFMMLDNNM